MFSQSIADKSSKFDPIASKTSGGLVPGRSLLSLDFTGAVLPSGATLTRASAGAFYNVAGVLSSAGNDNARFDYDPVGHNLKGILIEPAMTNLLIQSSNVANAAWTPNAAPTLAANAATSPDGTVDASTIVTSANSSGAYQFVTTVASTNYTISGYVKQVAGTSAFIVVGDDVVAATLGLQIVGGVISVLSGGGAIISSSCVPVGNGWYRYTVSFNSAANVSMSCVVFNGTTNPITLGVYGVQFEAGLVATSNVQSVATQGTRSADVLSFTVPAGVSNLRFTFDDSSTQTVAVSPGAYNVPTNLNRPWIRTIQSV